MKRYVLNLYFEYFKVKNTCLIEPNLLTGNQLKTKIKTNDMIKEKRNN